MLTRKECKKIQKFLMFGYRSFCLDAPVFGYRIRMGLIVNFRKKTIWRVCSIYQRIYCDRFIGFGIRYIVGGPKRNPEKRKRCKDKKIMKLPALY